MPEDPGENELRRSSRSNRSEVIEKSTFPQLVSLAAHDLRTPLATVSGFAKTLIRTEALEDPASRYVEIIQAAAGQMVELLGEDLRDLGAAVAALLVRALGGSVSVEDETLHVRLPE